MLSKHKAYLLIIVIAYHEHLFTCCVIWHSPFAYQMPTAVINTLIAIDVCIIEIIIISTITNGLYAMRILIKLSCFARELEY